MTNHSTLMFKLILTGLFLIFFEGQLSAATVDWKGTTNSNWSTTTNWSTGSLPVSGDAVRIGVVAFTNQLTLNSASATIASLTLGTSSNITLTISNGLTLTVTGGIVQNPSNTGNITSTITGAGSITCASLQVGNTTTFPPVLAVDLTEVISTVNNFHISGNVTVNSTDFAVLFIGVGFINTTFSLQGGTTTIDGTLLTTNTNGGILPLSFATPTFSIDMPTGSSQTPVLQLTNASAINTSSVAASIDFYNNTGGTGTCTVNYINSTGATQTVYTNTTAALSSSPDVYQYLQLTGTGSQTANGGNLTVANDINSSSGSVLLNTNNPTVTVGDSWTNSTNVTQGSGNITIANALQNSAGTFQLGTGNLTTSTLQNSGGTVAGGAGPGVVTVSGTFQNNGGTFQCNAENDYFNGLYQNTSTFTAGTGTVYFNGTAAQTLSDISASGTQFNNVSFSGTSLANAKTMSGSGGFAVSATGVLYMVGTTTKLDAGGVLTLISSSTSSASVAAITSGSTIINNVKVQRYLTGGSNYRSYRLISSPVYAATIAADTTNVYSINYLQNSAYLTGNAGGGFDKTGNPTLYLYREDQIPSNTTFISGNFEGISAINNSTSYNYSVTGAGTAGTFNIPVGNGVMFFFRGNRASATVAAETVTTYVPVTVTTTTTGQLNQGQLIVHDWYTPTSAHLGYTGTGTGTNSAVRGFNLVGNPYASSIDWEQYNTTTTTTGIYVKNVGPTIYEFDPNTHNYDTYQKGGAFTNHGTRTIASGQGFFVQAANSSSPQLIFNESAKTATQTSGLTLMMDARPDVAAINNANPDQHLRLQMAADSINTDDIYIGFNSTANAKYDVNADAAYKAGQGEVKLCSFSSDGVKLAINKLPLPGAAQTVIPLFVTASDFGTYRLNMTEMAGIPQLYEVWLMDRYNKDSLDMRHNTTYTFDITSDTNSYGSNRFQLVIRQDPALMVHLLNFTANKATSGAQVTWKTENEENYTNFTVERSTDNGATFTVLGGFTSSAIGTYSFLDKNPALSTDEYRLKLEDLNGTISYSNIVTLVYGNSTSVIAADITIYPNPASNVINLSVNKNMVGMPSANLFALQTPEATPSIGATQTNSALSYNISIINIMGSIIETTTSTQPTWQGNVSSLAPGSYFVTVTNNSNNSLVGKKAFIKL